MYIREYDACNFIYCVAYKWGGYARVVDGYPHLSSDLVDDLINIAKETGNGRSAIVNAWLGSLIKKRAINTWIDQMPTPESIWQLVHMYATETLQHMGRSVIIDYQFNGERIMISSHQRPPISTVDLEVMEKSSSREQYLAEILTTPTYRI